MAADGYESVFIFECKNWADPVGKNELVVFSEKVKVTGAQRGYFVAKKFTKDAEAQAALDNRVVLLNASEPDLSQVSLSGDFHYLLNNAHTIEPTLTLRPEPRVEMTGQLRLSDAVATWNGVGIDFEKQVNTWAEDAIGEDTNSFPSNNLPAGEYEREMVSLQKFGPGELIVDGGDVEAIETKIKYTAKIVRPVILSHFEIETRGRTYSLQAVETPKGSLQITIATG